MLHKNLLEMASIPLSFGTVVEAWYVLAESSVQNKCVYQFVSSELSLG